MDASPFNRLSPELRNTIYELALRHDDPIKFTKRRRFQDLVLSSPNVKESGLFGLPSTCRAIRMECLQLYYATNTFIPEAQRWSAADDVVDCLSEFMRCIGTENESAVRNVSLHRDSVHDLFSRRHRGVLSGPRLSDELTRFHAFATQHAKVELMCIFKIRVFVEDAMTTRYDLLGVVEVEVDIGRLAISPRSIGGLTGPEKARPLAMQFLTGALEISLLERLRL